MVSKIKTYYNLFINCENNNILGEVDDDINFTYDTNTEVYRSCAASLNNEMWVLGGSSKQRQVNLKLSADTVGNEIF